MGLYNPHFPHIIGPEWVPIREERLSFSPAVSAVEMGYEFLHQNNTDSATGGRYYIKEFPTRIPAVSAALFLAQPFFISLYPSGTETETGPIKVVRAPVQSGTSSNASLSNATSIQQALASPIDGRKIIMSASNSAGGTFSLVEVNFSMAAINQLLVNKRIVAVNVIYNMAQSTTPNTSYVKLHVDGGTEISYGLATYDDQGVIRLGDTNWWFSVTQPGLSFPSPFPWTPISVRRFDATNANPIIVGWQADSDEAVVEAAQWDFLYAALDIYYCEEKRLVMGGSISRNQGVNDAPLYTPGEVSSVSLDNKNYLITLAGADTGDSRAASNDASLIAQPYPALNALRQLYRTTYHRGVQVNHPSPVGTNILGQTFTSQESQVLPQITLNMSSGTPDVIGDVHPYGYQAAAQVYGSAVAEQTIEDSNIGSVTTQQVRYYARRFGNTTSRLELVRSTAPLTVIASLSPTEWDALEPENGIIDGWKEVTLDLDVPQTFTGTRPAFKWQATNETAGDRWEVLGMLAPAISGTPMSQYASAPANYALGIATYGWPVSGAADALRWWQVPPSQPVSAMPSAVDPTADAVLMFAVTPPAVTGFAITEASQALSGIADDQCSETCCTPTHISYHRLEWDMGVVDTFTRSAVSGWGSADTGDAWTIQSGAVSDFSVNGSNGVIHTPASGVSYFITQPKSLTDVEVAATIWTSVPVSGASIGVSLLARFADISNFYRARVLLNTNGLVTIAIDKNVAGVVTTLVTYADVMHLGLDTKLRLTFNVTGTMLKLTAQRLDADGSVLEDVTVYATDSSITTSGLTGVQMSSDTLTQLIDVNFDDYCAYPAELGNGGFYELQRMDELTDWQTIMRAGPCAWYMNDYEARVGIASTYRIRIVDALNFNGTWSAEVSNTLSSPGADGPTCFTGQGVLIFTTNYAQDGRYNVAYTMVWERDINEDFVFPEAQAVTLQRVYQRDFPMAFKGTERGGEQFSRNILVHNDEVEPVRLANIAALRNAAWAVVPYTCVRDELGDRWFALVQVPAESVRRNRQMYLSSVAVTQVTDTAFPVDPTVNT